MSWRLHITRSTRGLGIFALAALMAVAGLAGSLVYRQWFVERPYDPLGVYPDQTVQSSVPGIHGPAAPLDGPVIVTGFKCNNASHPVKVRGTSSWQPVDAAGKQTGTGVAARTGVGFRRAGPGCEALRYENPVPDEVRRITLQLHERGRAAHWRIVGVETPVADNGADGEARIWRTEPFRIVVEEPVEPDR